MISNLARQFLHAKTLGFIHPKNNKKMHFSSNLPHELNNIIKITDLESHHSIFLNLDIDLECYPESFYAS